MGQIAKLRTPVAEKSPKPKFSPLTVTYTPPLCGTFKNAHESTGESKENTLKPVPTVAATVTSTSGSIDGITPVKHLIVVDVNHVAVLHSAPEKRVVDVTSMLRKFRPITVIEFPPECGAFRMALEITGAAHQFKASSSSTVHKTKCDKIIPSNDTTSRLVPTRAAIVISAPFKSE